MNADSRLTSIDQFRGFAIVTMVLANYLAGVSIVPAWLKHAPDIGLTVTDLIAPFFIFAIGLTYGLSVRRRATRQGWRKAIAHVIIRYLGLIGLGAILSAGQTAFGLESGISWGVLQAIGVAGLVTLIGINLPTGWRTIFGLGLLTGYQWILDRAWLDTVLHSSHGGIQGALSWAAMLILGTALADLFHDPDRGRKLYPWIAALTLGTGLLLALVIPLSKNRVSASYVLVSLGISAIIFAVFNWLAGRLNLRLPVLSAWGKNPLLLYGLHFILLGLVVLPGIPGWYAEAPPGLVIVQALGLLAALSAVAWGCAWKGWYISL